ncbi:MAG TPA: reverse transcriptase domain-containing protein, partial [Burkholderiaceae bacterium]|nr:reverse transcriptase domain-containing protein [Burkholderiaceae bacterium]
MKAAKQLTKGQRRALEAARARPVGPRMGPANWDENLAMYGHGAEREGESESERVEPNPTGTADAPARRWRREEIPIPKDEREAEASRFRLFWRAARGSELGSWDKNKAFERVRRPVGRTVIPGKWVFDLKTEKEDGVQWVTRFKARYVAKGFRQVPGQDYTATFAPTPRLETVRAMLMVTLLWSVVLHSMDVKTAFLIPKLPPGEEVHLEPPFGDEPPPDITPDYVYKLLRCVYGLKQSGRYWHKEVSGYLRRLGFVPLHADPCLFILKNKAGEAVCMLVVHVDDLLIGADEPFLSQVKAKLNGQYEMKDLGEVSEYLGIRMRRSADGKIIEMDQTASIEDLLRDYQMENSNGTVSTPMSPKGARTGVEAGPLG